MITVRPAESRDAAPAASVLRASIRRLCAADHESDPERIAAWCANKTAAEFRRWLADPGARVLVAELNGRIAAVGAVSTDGEVLLNYVAPRSAARGVGTALLARLESELATLGHAEARLESTATAYRFYLARGWKATGASVSRHGIDGRQMRKVLAPAFRNINPD